MYGYVYILYLRDGRFYIGRRKGNKIDENYFGSGTIIKRYVKKNGTNDIKREIVGWADSCESLNHLEKICIDSKFKDNDKCMNLCVGGRFGELKEAPFKGKHHSVESRKKLSESKKKIWRENPEYRKRISEAVKLEKTGKKFSEEHKKKISIALKNYARTEEHRAKLREAAKNNGIKRRGTKVSEETKKKMSEALKGRSAPWTKGSHWYNNGKISVMKKECPEGFVHGRLQVFTEESRKKLSKTLKEKFKNDEEFRKNYYDGIKKRKKTHSVDIGQKYT